MQPPGNASKHSSSDYSQAPAAKDGQACVGNGYTELSDVFALANVSNKSVSGNQNLLMLTLAPLAQLLSQRRGVRAARLAPQQHHLPSGGGVHGKSVHLGRRTERANGHRSVQAFSRAGGSAWVGGVIFSKNLIAFA